MSNKWPDFIALFFIVWFFFKVSLNIFWMNNEMSFSLDFAVLGAR